MKMKKLLKKQVVITGCNMRQDVLDALKEYGFVDTESDLEKHLDKTYAIYVNNPLFDSMELSWDEEEDYIYYGAKEYKALTANEFMALHNKGKQKKALPDFEELLKSKLAIRVDNSEQFYTLVECLQDYGFSFTINDEYNNFPTEDEIEFVYVVYVNFPTEGMLTWDIKEDYKEYKHTLKDEGFIEIVDVIDFLSLYVQYENSVVHARSEKSAFEMLLENGVIIKIKDDSSYAKASSKIANLGYQELYYIGNQFYTNKAALVFDSEKSNVEELANKHNVPILDVKSFIRICEQYENDNKAQQPNWNTATDCGNYTISYTSWLPVTWITVDLPKSNEFYVLVTECVEKLTELKAMMEKGN